MSMDHRQMAAVIQAHIAGKPIQRQYKNDHRPDYWCDITWQGEQFNFEVCDYRVKPEPPKPREWDLRCTHVYEVGGAGSINALYNVGDEPIRVREVLEEDSVLKS